MDKRWLQHFFRAEKAGQIFGEGIADRFGEDACVAGGFLRDSYFGTKPKDLDVWVHPRHMPKLSRMEELEIEARREKYDALDVLHIIKEKWSGVPVEIIFVQPPDDVSIMDYLFDKFDIGICKIAYNHNEGLILHDDFLWDRDNKSVSLLKDTIGCYEHHERVLSKFPGWSKVSKLEDDLF